MKTGSVEVSVVRAHGRLDAEFYLGPVEGWFLRCGRCGQHKPLNTDTCRCGAKVYAVWVDPDEPTSPELVLVSRSVNGR